jgi:murein DD-endopeptidase MepM/ murein hydrolase activator NlpD
MKNIYSALLLLFCYLSINAQTPIQTRQYPKNFFRYPLDLSPSIVGSFGELRPSHFHGGLDFRTNQRKGYPVHAAADGYVARVRVQVGGGGNIVYLAHPNGYTTVYMHNERFNAAIAKAVPTYQYEHQQYDVDFNLPPGQIEVCQGDVISISGASGAVEGPHLHFEIRDTKTEEIINPQLFGITIPDRVAPSISSIGVYHLDNKPFSENTPHEFLAVAGSAGNYHLVHPGVINVNGNTGFGITTYDKNSASASRNGVYSIELQLDDKTVYTYAIERFGFDQTHAINAYIDYPTLLTTGRWMQKCFILPGNKVSLYPQSINRGIINFNDDETHEVKYIVKDVAGNTSTVLLHVKSHTPTAAAAGPLSGTLFHYDQKNEFTNDKVKVSIAPGNLYDDVDFVYSTLPMRPDAFSVTHHIHNRLTPIHDQYDLWIKPDRDLGQLANKAVIVSTDGGYAGGVYEDGYVKGQAKGFGNFYIRTDDVPPRIVPISISNGKNMAKLSHISLRISDNLSGIKSYNGKIDGKWVLMEWDYKTRVLSYTFDNIAPGKHNFELTVTDNKDNNAVYTADFYK